MVSESKLARFAVARQKLSQELLQEGLQVPTYSPLTKGSDLEHDVGVINESGLQSREAIGSLREIEWQRLTAGQRSAAKILGFNQETWDYNDGLDPDFGELYWGELTPPEQVAAETLGFEEESWEREKLGRVDSFGSGMNGRGISSTRRMSAYGGGPFSTLAGGSKAGAAPSSVLCGPRGAGRGR
jgi:hypothetical protein